MIQELEFNEFESKVLASSEMVLVGFLNEAINRPKELEVLGKWLELRRPSLPVYILSHPEGAENLREIGVFGTPTYRLYAMGGVLDEWIGGIDLTRLEEILAKRRVQ